MDLTLHESGAERVTGASQDRPPQCHLNGRTVWRSDHWSFRQTSALWGSFALQVQDSNLLKWINNNKKKYRLSGHGQTEIVTSSLELMILKEQLSDLEQLNLNVSDCVGPRRGFNSATQFENWQDGCVRGDKDKTFDQNRQWGTSKALRFGRKKHH